MADRLTKQGSAGLSHADPTQHPDKNSVLQFGMDLM